MISMFTAGGVAILVAGFGTPLLLRWLVKWRIGQHIREDGPAQHAAKQGTPTMGGIAMLVAMLSGYVLGHVGTNAPFTRSGWLVVLAVLATGLIGAADDWIKVSRKRSLGLNKRAKATAQLGVGVGFALGSLYWAGTARDLSFTRFDVPGLVLPAAVYVLWS
ncbi:MAG: phospho-N-acetylmuramoyl-pentapeptide-transferase, partial [Acidimicrobiales bacterium]